MFWKSHDMTHKFNFNSDLLVPEDAVTIQGEYSEDLDLFYTSSDVRRLFDYFIKDYAKICSLALASIRLYDDQDKAR